MILGVDCWHGYGVIAWHRAAKAGVRFAIAKCTEGNEGKDPAYDRNVAGCKEAGILVGAYHFAFPLPSGPGKPAGRSPKEQAERFFTGSNGLGAQPGELPPVLDLEWPPQHERDKKSGEIVNKWVVWDVDAASIADWGLECLAEMERLWGRTPALYTYPFFWQTLGAHGLRSEWARYPLWIANYTHPGDGVPPATKRPAVPAPWKDWAIWQFSADGSPARIDGIPVSPIDRNVVRDEETLRRLAWLDGPDTEPEIRAAPVEPVVVVDEPATIEPATIDGGAVHPPVPLGRPRLDDA